MTLPDGSVVSTTKEAVHRTLVGQTLWSIPAQIPDRLVAFEDSKKTPLLLYYERLDDKHAAFRAVRQQDGKLVWSHDFWYALGMMDEGVEGAAVVSPLFHDGRIYFGRACWLDALDPDAGIVMERHFAGALIKGLEMQKDGTLRVLLQIRGFSAPQSLDPSLQPLGTLLFTKGRLLNPIRVVGFGFQRLLNFAVGVDTDFVGLGRFDRYNGYLDLERFKPGTPPSEQFLRKYANFDLKATEVRFREAYRQDPLNPYLPLYLGLCLRSQSRAEEAEALFKECYAPFARDDEEHTRWWHDVLWIGRELEGLGLTRWADAFYEKGIAMYFRSIPSPADRVSAIDVLIHFPAGSRIAMILFATGHVERALHLVDIRRQIFPCMEGDRIWGHRYAEWLRATGNEAKAVEEERRLRPIEWDRQVNAFTLILGPAGTGFLLAAMVLLVFLLLRLLGAADQVLGVACFLALTAWYVDQFPEWLDEKTLGRAALYLLLGGLLVTVDTWLKLRWTVRPRAEASGERTPLNPRRALTVLLSRSWPMYGLILMTAAVGAARICQGMWSKVGTLAITGACLMAFALWGRSRPEAAWCRPAKEPKKRPLVGIVLVILLFWVMNAVLLVNIHRDEYVSRAIIPSIDYGHPLWVQRFHEAAAQSLWPSRDLLFAKALSSHLAGLSEQATAEYRDSRLAGDARAMNNLAVLRLGRDPKGAEQMFRQALKIDAKCAAALYNLFLQTGDRALLERARALEPWRVGSLERYCPGRPMVATVTYGETAPSGAWTQENVWGILNPIRGWLKLFKLFNVMGQS